MNHQDKVTDLASSYLDKHKLYVEDGVLRCRCGERFDTTQQASTHFITTTEQHVNDNTGFRAWWRRMRGRK